jgi:hypothetical protein
MKQLNNKTLAIILLVLIAAFILTKVFRSPRLESNVKTDLLGVDTSLVNTIEIHPHKQPGTTVRLTRQGNQWSVTQGQRTAKAENSLVHDLLVSIARINVQRMMSRKKKNWNDYAVGDTSGTHVIVYGAGNPLADFWIGETGAGSGPYRQNTSYIRLNNRNEVYEAAAGYLGSSFNKTYDDWRDHSFLRMDKSKITKIIFQYPADSGFTVVKKGAIWMIGDKKADSTRMADYLNQLQFKNLDHFADHFSPAANPDVVITIENNTNPVMINAWKEGKEWVLTSTLRKNIYFSSEGSDIVKELFVSKNILLSAHQK